MPSQQRVYRLIVVVRCLQTAGGTLRLKLPPDAAIIREIGR